LSESTSTKSIILVAGCWLLVTGFLLPVAGGWLLVDGCWLLVSGSSFLVTGDPFTRDFSSFKKQETGNRDLKTYSATGEEKQNIAS